MTELEGNSNSVKRKLLVFPAAALLAFTALTAGDPSAAEEANSKPVTIQVNAAVRGKDLPPIWRFFGADEPNYATMKNGKKLIAELGALAPKNVYFRAHNLLTSGDGTPALKWGSTGAYDEKPDGAPV